MPLLVRGLAAQIELPGKERPRVLAIASSRASAADLGSRCPFFARAAMKPAFYMVGTSTVTTSMPIPSQPASSSSSSHPPSRSRHITTPVSARVRRRSCILFQSPCSISTNPCRPSSGPCAVPKRDRHSLLSSESLALYCVQLLLLRVHVLVQTSRPLLTHPQPWFG